MNILILGASGLLGSALMRVIPSNKNYNVQGSIRSSLFASNQNSFKNQLISSNDLLIKENLDYLIDKANPNVVINCLSASGFAISSGDILELKRIYQEFPSQLSFICREKNIRLINFSSDGVFSGNGNGDYTEEMEPDASDPYGMAKKLGENACGDDALTLRTSIIGHQRGAKNGLLEWFLSQKDRCIGYENVVFTGLPAVEIGEILRDYVIPNKKLRGLFNIAGRKITKFQLLKLISVAYSKDIEIIPASSPVLNRSLNASKFQRAAGYSPPPWTDLIFKMKNFREE